MLVAGNELAHGTELDAGVVVVGAGPAGIVLALELGRAGVDVLLVESGGTRPDERTQRLADAAELDGVHVPMHLATRRQVGGASAIWGGRCVPYDPVDFAPREIVGDARWPVTYDELRGVFQRACDWFVVGDAVFDAQQVPGLAGRTLVPGLPDGPMRTSDLERWSLPTHFGRVYRRELERSHRVTLLTGLTCTNVRAAGGERRVERLQLKALDGREITVRPRTTVLACGGVETTRLLLASDRLGDHSGHLGRWYMAHLESRIGEVRFTTPQPETIYGHERDHDGVYVRRRITFTPEAQAEHGLPNVAIWLVNPPLGDPSHGNGVLSFAYLALSSPAGRFFASDAIRRSHLKTDGPVSRRAHVRNVLRHLPSAAAFAATFGSQRFLRPGRKVPAFYVPSAANVYPLVSHAEHRPHRDSTITLTGERDELGLPRVKIDLRFGDDETEAIVRAHRLMDAELRRHGVGSVALLSDDPAATVREQLHGGYHQAGTTRMSERPEDGVLDRDLAVHGFDDLYVASSSAFPTSGQANSTFMVVVCAIRLADHLRRRLGS